MEITAGHGVARSTRVPGVRELGWTGKGASTPNPAAGQLPIRNTEPERSREHIVPWPSPLWAQRNAVQYPTLAGV
jgi:hypothetical protein